jgi:hypothetical protein
MSFLFGLTQAGLALILLWASVAKRRQPADFGAALRFCGLRSPMEYRLISTIGLSELAIGVGLIVGWTWSTYAVTPLLLLATAFLLELKRRKYRTGCGCFGASKQQGVSARRLAFNGVICVLAVCLSLRTWILGAPPPFWKLWSTSLPGMVAVGVIVVVLEAFRWLVPASAHSETGAGAILQE